MSITGVPVPGVSCTSEAFREALEKRLSITFPSRRQEIKSRWHPAARRRAGPAGLFNLRDFSPPTHENCVSFNLHSEAVKEFMHCGFSSCQTD